MSTGKSENVTSSPDPERRDNIDKVGAKLPGPVSRSDQWAKDCMARDSQRCVISGFLAESAWEEQNRPAGVDWGNLEVHHIIPLSLGGYKKTVCQLTS